MAAIHSYNDSLNANFKNTYADTIENLIPENNHFLRDIKFVPREKQQGGTYVQPVKLAHAHGITYAASGTVPNLNAAVTSTYKQAQVEAYQTIMREQISYDVAARASSTENAFRDATAEIVQGMRESHAQKLEAEVLYGQNNWGTVQTPAATTLLINLSDWAPGLWVGGENVMVDIWDPTLTTLRTTAQVTGIDFDTRTLTVTSTAGVLANDWILPKGAAANQMAGIHKILTNTGTLFNVPAATYSLWKATSFSAGGAALTFKKVIDAAARASVKGQMGKVRVYVNPKAFADLTNEIEGARNYGGEQYVPKNMERGIEFMKFFSPVGVIEIVVHNMVKEGYAYGLEFSGCWKRIGATDVTFKIPGRPQEEFFLELENSAGYEMRSFSDFSVFCSKPACNFIITNIVNT